MEKKTFEEVSPSSKWWFSIAMLVFGSVPNSFVFATFFHPFPSFFFGFKTSQHLRLPGWFCNGQKKHGGTVDAMMTIRKHILAEPLEPGGITRETNWCSSQVNTVDGRNPAPVDRQFIPLFTGFYKSQVVSRISSINSMKSVSQQYHEPGQISFFVWSLWSSLEPRSHDGDLMVFRSHYVFWTTWQPGTLW